MVSCRPPGVSLFVDLRYFGLLAAAAWGALAALVYQRIRRGRDARWLTDGAVHHDGHPVQLHQHADRFLERPGDAFLDGGGVSSVPAGQGPACQAWLAGAGKVSEVGGHRIFAPVATAAQADQANRQGLTSLDVLVAAAWLATLLHAFHAPALPGGGLGLDLLIVVAGYCLSRPDLGWPAAARRATGDRLSSFARVCVLPAGLMVLACLPAAWLWLTPGQFKEFGQAAAALSLLLSNHYFDYRTGPAGQAADLAPLFHTWLLALLAQLGLAVLLLHWLLKGARTRTLLAWSAALAAASLALDSSWGAAHPMTSFFLLPTRAWEFLAGSLVALALSMAPQPYRRPWSWPAALGGLGLMVLAMVLASDIGGPPDMAARLAMVAGSALILGSTAGAVWAPSWLPAAAADPAWRDGLWHVPLAPAGAGIRARNRPAQRIAALRPAVRRAVECAGLGLERPARLAGPGRGRLAPPAAPVGRPADDPAAGRRRLGACGAGLCGAICRRSRRHRCDGCGQPAPHRVPHRGPAASPARIGLCSRRRFAHLGGAGRRTWRRSGAGPFGAVGDAGSGRAGADLQWLPAGAALRIHCRYPYPKGRVRNVVLRAIGGRADARGRAPNAGEHYEEMMMRIQPRDCRLAHNAEGESRESATFFVVPGRLRA